MEVWFRYQVTDSSDASLVGEVFEDSYDPPEDNNVPWVLIHAQTILYAYPYRTLAIHSIMGNEYDEFFGSEDGIPHDGQLLQMNCYCAGLGTPSELWLGASELDENGNPSRLVGFLVLYGLHGKYHRVELESIKIRGY